MQKLLLFILILLISENSTAQDGTLDNSFDDDGTLVSLLDVYTTGDAVALQEDGKIVVGASAIIGITTDIAVLRYNTDGSLDNTFNGNGTVTTDLNNGQDYCTSIAIQSDGKIVAGGFRSDSLYHSSIVIIRYNANGSIDNSFGNSGKVVSKYSDTYNFGYDLIIQQDGKIVVAGASKDSLNKYIMVVFRYLSDGSVDNSFNGTGILPIDFGGLASLGNSITQQADGKLIAVGHSNVTAGNTKIALARINTNGSLDTSFGNAGEQLSTLNSCQATGVKLQSDGKIIVGGFGNVTNVRAFALLRFNTTGSVDSTFNDDGIITTIIGNFQNTALDVALQNDGHIILGGFSKETQQGRADYTLVRYTNTGSIDATFGNDGIVLTIINNSESTISAIAIQQDGKIVAVGRGLLNNNSGVAIARYNNTPLSNSLENIQTQLPITIYPNPFTTTTTLSSEWDLQNAKLTITDARGKQVKVMEHMFGRTIKLDCHELPGGTYFLHLFDNNGSYSAKRIVVTK